MRQAAILLDTEGDAWLARNRAKLGKDGDPVMELMAAVNVTPQRVLEIGASNGWRLRNIRATYNCLTAGIEPGAAASQEGADVGVIRGTADRLPVAWTGTFDLVIAGFFLYFADPSDYLRIAAEADRVLKDPGFLIVYDFASARTFKRPYAYDARIFSHHFDPSSLWLGHPAYKRIADRYNSTTTECVSLLEKDVAAAFPLEQDSATR